MASHTTTHLEGLGYTSSNKIIQWPTDQLWRANWQGQAQSCCGCRRWRLAQRSSNYSCRPTSVRWSDPRGSRVPIRIYYMSTSYVYLWHSSRRQKTSWHFLQKSSSKHIRHSQLNDLICRAVRKAQIHATKEPIGLSRTDGKRPNRATLISWMCDKPLAWDVTVTDTYTASHIVETAECEGAAATKRQRTR